MRGTTAFVSSLLLVALLLTLSSAAASFAPKSSMKRMTSLRGGGENNNLPNSTPQTPPQAPPPVDVESASTTSNSGYMGSKATPPGILRRAFPSLPWHKLPNYLTYLRCVAIPIFMVLFQQPNQHVATGTLFAFASFTDWLDGYLARRWDITSAFGAFLDPVADKLMVSTSLVLLAGRYGAVLAIPTAIILAREIAVSALREWMAQRGQRDAVKVGFQGKLKTALTMVALTVLLLVPFPKPTTTESSTTFLSSLYTPGLVMLYACAVVTVTSGSVYFKAAAPVLMDSKQ